MSYSVVTSYNGVTSYSGVKSYSGVVVNYSGPAAVG